MQRLFSLELPFSRFAWNTLVASLAGLLPLLVLFIAMTPDLAGHLAGGGPALSRFVRQVLTNGVPVVFVVNYVAFFLVTKHLGRILRDQHAGGPGWLTDIIQINSKSGLRGSNRNGAYAGSKFGGIGLVQSFAVELVEHGVKVNAICPGNFLDGPLWSDPVKGLFVQYWKSGKVPGAKSVDDVRRHYEAQVPMRRGTFGADVMRAVYYLVEQAYETGQALPVTGGQVMLSS